MAREIFRKAALERMASPERLDRPLALVGAPGWLLLSAIAGALVFAAAWALMTEARVKVSARGILIDRAGLVEIVSGEDGQIRSLDISPGDMVSAGQPVATLSRAELERELLAARAALTDAAERVSRLEAFHREQEARQAQAARARLETIAETRRVLGERLALLNERAADIGRLVDKQVVLRDRLLDAQIDASTVRERISSLEDEEMRITLAEAERDSERRLKLLDEKLVLEEQERRIARLTDRLAERRAIRSPHGGQVVELKVNPGDVVRPGTALATLAPAESGARLVALLYVPPADGKRVEVGMTAEIAPTTVKREIYGHIRGEVISVAPLPATPEGMRRTLQNDQLVEQLGAEGAPFEVRVALTRDAATQTGFRWSSSRGPAAGVGAGAMVEGAVVVGREPLVNLVVPGAAERLGLGAR